MGYKYAVVGAGRQGIAAAYDLARFGYAESVLIVDRDVERAWAVARRLSHLVGRENIFFPIQAEVGAPEMGNALKGVDAFISAVPYKFNLALTQMAIELGVNMCDLGGNTEIVLKQHEMHDDARAAGISIIPDCGMGPGMNVSPAAAAITSIGKPRELRV